MNDTPKPASPSDAQDHRVDHDLLPTHLQTYRANRAATDILRRTGAAAGLLAEHRANPDRECRGPHGVPTRWPCELASLCLAALECTPADQW